MAIVIRGTNFPEGVGTQMYDAVDAEMNLADNPPAGMIFHFAGEIDGEWTIFDLWEDRAAYDRFTEEILFPAIKKVSGMDPTEGPQPTIDEFDVHNYAAP
jgi:hypothetical protein